MHSILDDDKMTVVKKTVAIHPIIDGHIRKAWAILVQNGWDATYSTALNWMLLCQFLETGKKGISKETQKILTNYLEDETTIQELNAHDYERALKELSIKRLESKYVS
jgi:hypothetical protein